MSNRPRPPLGMVTCASVARTLGRTAPTLLAWADKGEFPKPTEVCGRRYFIEAAVNDWIAKRFPDEAPQTQPAPNHAR